MKTGSKTPARVLAGFLLTAAYGLPQAYTVSAKPGIVNYIEGDVYLNGNRLSNSATKATFLGANDMLSTDIGKVEVLLTPGVFLRLGDGSQIRMISPSLTDMQVELVRGEAMVEAAGLAKENKIQIVDHGGLVRLDKNGLYRFTAYDPPAAEVIAGKAEVFFGEREIALSKGHETVLGGALKAKKFDAKREDDLYAWSNIRSEYDAAASYQAANDALLQSNGSAYGGWYFASLFDCWAWLPGSGAFYSPFGWGFYSPGVVLHAPVVTTGVVKGGHWVHDPDRDGDHDGDHHHRRWQGPGRTAPVPVNPKRPPVVGRLAASPAEERTLRTAAAQSFAQSGFRTQSGAPALGFSGNRPVRADSGRVSRWYGGSGRAAGQPGGFARSAGSGGSARTGGSGGHSGGFSGGGHSGGFGAGGHSGGFSGGGHSGGGGGGHAGGGGGSGGGGSHGGGGGGSGHSR